MIKKYFSGSLWISGVGLALSFLIGYYYGGTYAAGISALFLTFVLSILEVSISFDNAIVNAAVLKEMTPLWQRRFLTWGILIAVFGMRLIFPLVIVSVAAGIGPIEALSMATFHPHQYAEHMHTAHIPVAAFGGAFLMMVALKYFFDTNKDVHWIHVIEKPMVHLGKMEAIEAALVLLVLYGIQLLLPEPERFRFMISGIFGLISYIAVDGIGAFLEAPSNMQKDLHKASAGMFLYLEVLDASFSFDGVVGAFAITDNLFLIAIGLGIGAMFVRSLTIVLVEKNTLAEFRFLEHGAFYAIGSLASLMFLGAVFDINEVVTGLIGAAFILLSIHSSVTYRRKNGSSHAH